MKIVCIMSGGMDSSTLVYHYWRNGHNVTALGFDYGQRHKKELISAAEICKGIDVSFTVADLSRIAPLIAGQSSQLNPDVDVPHGHYAAENMKQTVVPNRNMIMLSVAIGHAISEQADAVAYGAHAGDHTIYPDCREEFACALDLAAMLCDWRKVRLLRPFSRIGKHDICAMGDKHGVPFEKTWSCYEGQEVHCGKCGTCVERREAFELSNVQDPTIYGAL